LAARLSQLHLLIISVSVRAFGRHILGRKRNVLLRKQRSLRSCFCGVISFLVLLFPRIAPAQSAPVSAHRLWHTSTEVKVEAEARNLPEMRFALDAAKTYTLAELIDLAEAHNPATRAAWERARAQAADLGVTRSEVYPTLAAAALSQTSRSEGFSGGRFVSQVFQDFQVELDLNYTVFDFGARSGRISAAKARFSRLTSLSMTLTAM
jgi:outer membrane protein